MRSQRPLLHGTYFRCRSTCAACTRVNLALSANGIPLATREAGARTTQELSVCMRIPTSHQGERFCALGGGSGTSGAARTDREVSFHARTRLASELRMTKHAALLFLGHLRWGRERECKVGPSVASGRCLRRRPLTVGFRDGVVGARGGEYACDKKIAIRVCPTGTQAATRLLPAISMLVVNTRAGAQGSVQPPAQLGNPALARPRTSNQLHSMDFSNSLSRHVVFG